MRTLIPATTELVARRPARSTVRALVRIEDETTAKLARIEQAAHIQASRVEALGYVGQRAMNVVALTSEMEKQLATIVPMATGRLQAVADMVALSAADIVSDTVRRLR